MQAVGGSVLAAYGTCGAARVKAYLSTALGLACMCMKFDTRPRDGIIAWQPGALAPAPPRSLVLGAMCLPTPPGLAVSRPVPLLATPSHGGCDEIYIHPFRTRVHRIATRSIPESHSERVGREARERRGGKRVCVCLAGRCKTAQGRSRPQQSAYLSHAWGDSSHP